MIKKITILSLFIYSQYTFSCNQFFDGDYPTVIIKNSLEHILENYHLLSYLQAENNHYRLTGNLDNFIQKMPHLELPTKEFAEYPGFQWISLVDYQKNLKNFYSKEFSDEIANQMATNIAKAYPLQFYSKKNLSEESLSIYHFSDYDLFRFPLASIENNEGVQQLVAEYFSSLKSSFQKKLKLGEERIEKSQITSLEFKERSHTYLIKNNENQASSGIITVASNDVKEILPVESATGRTLNRKGVNKLYEFSRLFKLYDFEDLRYLIATAGLDIYNRHLSNPVNFVHYVLLSNAPRDMETKFVIHTSKIHEILYKRMGYGFQREFAIEKIQENSIQEIKRLYSDKSAFIKIIEILRRDELIKKYSKETVTSIKDIAENILKNSPEKITESIEELLGSEVIMTVDMDTFISNVIKDLYLFPSQKLKLTKDKIKYYDHLTSFRLITEMEAGRPISERSLQLSSAHQLLAHLVGYESFTQIIESPVYLKSINQNLYTKEMLQKIFSRYLSIHAREMDYQRFLKNVSSLAPFNYHLSFFGVNYKKMLSHLSVKFDISFNDFLKNAEDLSSQYFFKRDFALMYYFTKSKESSLSQLIPLETEFDYFLELYTLYKNNKIPDFESPYFNAQEIREFISYFEQLQL
ncbi:MAG: hypothetical protein H6620_05400 [Halobacteriovoraceae bacterium]|nr:hypothetical protein [Halobacteriovoraceae bacterium]